MDDRCARVVLDRQGIIRFANAAADRLLGKRPGDLLGKPFPMELPAEGPAAIRIDMHHSGRRTAVVSAAPIEWNDGPARLVTLTDDTDLRELDRLKADLSARLVETEAKDQLINGISHEMRNPLTIIKTALYALRGRLAGPLTPQQDKFLDMATRNIDRQIRMVENVLDLGHLRSGRLQIEFGRVDLIALIAQLTEEFQLVNPTVRLELEMPKQLPPARAESELVAQVLRNLLDNAVRFARSKVTLKATGAEDQVLISVVDDGVGIPKEHLDEIFHQYVQLHRPSGRGYKGTGLGLAICREIVERHGGRIWVESVFGMGSRFHFTLLLADASVTDSSNIIHPSAMVGPGSGGYNQSL